MMNEIVIDKLYDTGMTYLTTSVISEKDQRWILRWFRSNKPDLCREVFGDMHQPNIQHPLVYRDPPVSDLPTVGYPLQDLQPVPPQVQVFTQPVPQPFPQPILQPVPRPVVRQPEVTPTPAPIIPPSEDQHPINHVFDYREAIRKPQNRYVNRSENDFSEDE